MDHRIENEQEGHSSKGGKAKLGTDCPWFIREKWVENLTKVDQKGVVFTEIMINVAGRDQIYGKLRVPD